MKRLLTISYGVASYLVFLVAFLYLIGFVGNFLVPRSIDTGVSASVGVATVVNMALLALFAIQHSVMARPAFKRRWTQWVPTTIERSTYVLLSSLLLFLLFWQWRAMSAVIWDVSSATGRLVLWTLFWAGWAMVLSSTFMINHFDLFGLRQVYLAWHRKPYSNIAFKTHLLYRLIRHPLLVGFVIAFWATPTMTAGHLLFAAVWTGYILAAARAEEHDLAAALGEPYRDYQRRVPGWIPWPRQHGQSTLPRARHA